MSKIGFLICCLISITIVQCAFAHGTVTSPPSRVYNCYQENPENPSSAPCIAAVASHGTQPLYDWNEINQGNANGQHIDLIQDGNLASGGRPIKYGGMDLISPDWVATPVSPGPFTVTWTNTAPHATSYYLVYITNADWTPDQALTWSSLTLLKQTDPSTAESSVDIPVVLPARTGKHVIYSIWQRSDSGEAFYSTSDIDFGSAPLNSELTSFQANLSSNNEVELRWITASERENAYFEVEHSIDGTNFNAIGKVSGSGTTVETQYYNFVDNRAMNGKNYYRLRQVDFDGRFEYSPVELLDIQSTVSLTIYPTIATNSIQIQLKEENENELNFQIFDITGRYVQIGNIDAGSNFIDFSVADLQNGVYFIRFEIEGEIITEQFVKL